jgi:hypothetical protein
MLERLRRKAQKLVWLEFQSLERAPNLSLEISPEELEQELIKVPTQLFLGRYNKEDIRAKLERNQVLPALRSYGFEPLILEVESDGFIEHRIFIHTGERNYDRIVMELRLREGVFKVKDTIAHIKPGLAEMIKSDTIPMLWIDWLLLQNPSKKFSPVKPRLPEQKYPGLGVLYLVVPLMAEFARETHKQAVLDIPEHFHGAYFYSRWMKFFNPEMEGKTRAILRDLAGYSLATISWGVLLDCLFNIPADRHESWRPGEQIYPISDALEKYFDSESYRQTSSAAFEQNSYRLDFARMKERAKFLEPDEKATVEAIIKGVESAGEKKP